MARYTRDEMLQKLKDLTAQDVVYKVEVDDAKYHLGNVYDRAKYSLGEEFTHAGKWQALTEVENAIDLPYSLQHLFGKKFLKSLEDAITKVGRTAYLDAVGHMVSEMSPLNTMMQALIARQVKGRRPQEPKTIIGTRTQLRAICPCCFRQHAVDEAGRMVAHGYTLEYGYQNGTCSGHRKPHFGTVEGRTITEQTAERSINDAGMIEKNADVIEADPTGHTIRDSRGHPIEKPTIRDVKLQIERMRYSARQRRSYAAFLNQQVAQWKPADPVEVTVDITE